MTNLLMRTTAAAAAALALLAGSAWAAEPTVKELNVTAEYTDLTDSNAKDYYPDISDDLLVAITDKMSLTDDPLGYVVNVNLQSVSLDGDTALPDSREFNTMEGVVSFISPQTDAPAEGYPIKVIAMSGDSQVPEGFIAVDPSVGDFYRAMVDGFANAVVEKMPEYLRDAGSK